MEDKTIAELLEEAGLSMSEAARKTGTSRNTWNGWKRYPKEGSRKPWKLAISWLELIIEIKKLTAELLLIIQGDIAPVPPGGNGNDEVKAELRQLAAELAQCDFLPSDTTGDYPSRTYSGAKVARMMVEARERAREMAIRCRRLADTIK